MLSEWLHMREELTRVMTQHRALCGASAPDPVALSRNRWLISNVSRQRATWLTGTALPAAERLAHTPGGAGWLALQAHVPAYRQRISGFVSRWPIEAIVKDWVGYRHATAELRFEIAQWLRKEEVAMRALVAEMESMPAMPPLKAGQA
ncbi:hypothetical protein QE363_003786 [Sphingomonas sp. SORGH_AS870]|uniref:hypothetical protein n=1 Tax=Sphingomonas sp. SORGH_AS_0870 TaxID=3041801 RepID=UPI0028658CAD|nr:hypothetical protein [Sphingomonas sp. SORGH_AS_0870]MDR6147993.1 hypothetical protein [Sphingomonas sp. SORGH_AS_0870]